MINILIVLHNANYFSGATHSMIDLMSYWKKQDGVNMYVLLPEKGSAEAKLREIGIEYKIIKYYLMRKHSDQSSKIKEYMKGTLKRSITLLVLLPVIRDLKARKFDYIYSNTSSIYIGLYLSEILKVRHIWHIREFGREDQERISYDGEKRLYSRMNKSFKIIAISDSLKQYLVDKGVREGKITVVYNDVLYTPKENANKSFAYNNEYIALSCGSLIKNKGHLTAIKSICKIIDRGYNIKLYIAGATDTDYAKELQKYVFDNHLENSVFFCGFVKDMDKLRASCNIAIVGSNAEAFGRITIEAMLSGLIVIGSNSYGTADLIQNGYNGYLFEAKNADDLANKIIYTIRDKEKSIDVINNGKIFAEKFNGHIAADKILNMMLENQIRGIF